MTPPLGLTRESGKRWEAPHLKVLESQGLIRVGGTLCSSGDGGSLDGFWRRLPGPSRTWVEFLTLCREYCASCPVKPSGSSQAERTPLCSSTTRCDGGYGNPGRRSGCIAEGMPRPSGHHLRVEALGFLRIPPIGAFLSPPYSLGAAGAPSWKSE